MLFKHVNAQFATTAPCELAFVGDAPGDFEVCKGTPFCGPSGQIFDKMLRLAGIERSACWVGNVFDEQIPGNDIKSWCQRDQGTHRFAGAGFLQEAYEWHFARLTDELNIARPALIIPMGSVALWAFTGSTNIGNARGAVQRATAVVPGAKLLPTFHPSYVLRQYKMLGTVVSDFKKALSEAARPAETLKLSRRELWLDPELADIEDFIARYLLKSELITIDIETSVNQITEIGFSADSEHAITIKFVDYRRANRCFFQTLDEEIAAWDLVQRICALPNPKLFQNGPFDNWHLIRNNIRVVNWREDTRLLHHALYPELPKSLAYMGATYAHEGPWKLDAHSGKAKRDA